MHLIKEIERDTEINRLLYRTYTTPFRTGYVEVGEDKFCLPVCYKDYEERIENFAVKNDDVFLCGISKSGTTWCHELLWLLVNDLDYELAKEPNVTRCPVLEFCILYDFKLMKMEEFGNDPLAKVETLKSPRCIKSHLAWHLLPREIRDGIKQPKIVFISRNPKDTCVSHYYQATRSEGFRGTLEEFGELTLHGKVTYGPYWKHRLSYWAQRLRPNILFLTYEEMKMDLQGVIRKTAIFLGKSLSETQIAELEEHLSFKSMKENPALNMREYYKKLKERHSCLVTEETDFIKTGKIGGHKSLISPELNARFDAWIAENTAETDLVVL